VQQPLSVTFSIHRSKLGGVRQAEPAMLDRVSANGMGRRSAASVRTNSIVLTPCAGAGHHIFLHGKFSHYDGIMAVFLARR
jgi:hypothetical protein